MKINSTRELKELLFNNSLRFHHITQTITFNGLFEFTVTFEHLTEDGFTKIQGILDLGIKNVTFKTIEYY